MELASDFSEFCASLNANHVEYLVVGAYAMALHGVPRYTGDLDIFIRPTPENGARLTHQQTRVWPHERPR